jgi:predicted Zn-dependent peptidase
VRTAIAAAAAPGAIVAAVAVALAVAAAATTDQALPEHQLTTLPNGVRVATQAMPGLHSVALGVFVGVGSRDEDAAHNGISHFIEHLLFRGSETHDALEIAQRFDRFGSELNASTSREYTEISTRIRDRHLDEAMAIIGGMVRSPTWDGLEHEREVVLEEIAMYDDAPDDRVHDMLGEAVFADDPLGRPIVGTADVIAAMPPDAVAEHHRQFYTGGNIVVSAAGAVDHERMVELTAAQLGGLAADGRPQRREAAIPNRPARRFVEKDTEQFHLCLGAPGISRHDPRRFAAGLLDQILGGGASSRLFQEIRERRGMAYAVYSYAAHYRETGQVGIYVGTRAEHVAACSAVLRAEIAALAEGRLGPDELARAKDAATGRLALASEFTAARMARVGKSLLLGVEILSDDEICDLIEAVGDQEIADLAGELFDPARLSAACIGDSAEPFERALHELVTA